MTREMAGLDPTLRIGKFEIEIPAVRPRPAFERHYSVEELAKIWRVSDEFVRRLFLREPGVVVVWREQPGKRVYRTLRIPESVAERVHNRMTKL